MIYQKLRRGNCPLVEISIWGRLHSFPCTFRWLFVFLSINVEQGRKYFRGNHGEMFSLLFLFVVTCDATDY